jgi:hypothetical protein
MTENRNYPPYRFTPDGQITESCPAPFAKIFSFLPDPNQMYMPRRPVPKEGRCARHERWVRDAVDAGGAADESADADGKAVWS